MTLDATVVGSFVLVLARTSAWVIAAPVFSVRGIASVGRLAVALSLALFFAPIEARLAPPPGELPPFLVLLIGQALIGLVLGWGTGLLMHAFEAAGAAIDLNSGFAISTVFDPMSGVNSSVFARFSHLLFITLMVATNAHHTILDGFARSFSAFPAGTFPSFDGEAALGAASAVTALMVAAVEIGAPVLGAVFLTEVGIALANRFVPQANVFAVGLPLKVLLALVVMGSALIVLPSQLGGLVDHSLRVGEQLLR